MAAWSVVWEVLDDSGSPVGQLRSSGGSVAWDGKARIQRVVRGARFDHSEWAAINPFRDRLRLLWVADTGDTTSLGVFHVAQLGRRFIDANNTSNPEPYLVDGALFLDQPSEQGFYGRLGELLSDVMNRVCDQAGVTDRTITPTGAYCGEPLLAPAGTSYLQSLTGVARLANFLPPHFDRNGTLQLVPPPALASEPVASYTSTSVVRESRTSDDNLLDAPNVFLVMGSGASFSEIVAEVEVDQSAPHSVSNRGGRRVVFVQKEQGIESVSQAQQIAAQLALTQALDLETVAFATLPNPDHDCYGIVSLNDETYRETSWSLPLRPGSTMMTHALDRADPTGSAT